MKLTELLRRYNCSIQFVTVHLLFLDNYDNCNNMHAVFTHSSSSTIGLHSHVSSLVGYYTLPKFPSVHWIRNFASSKLNAANRSKLKLLGIFAPPPSEVITIQTFEFVSERRLVVWAVVLDSLRVHNIEHRTIGDHVWRFHDACERCHCVENLDARSELNARQGGFMLLIINNLRRLNRSGNSCQMRWHHR